MPHLDGFQLAQQIRTSASNHSVPIVMVTGNDDVQSQRLAFSLGVTLFLGKPITPKQVTGVINAMRGAFLREKRRYARLTLLTPVVCTWESKGPHRLEARSLDIAEQGMALMQVPGLGAGLQLDLEFMLPDSPERLQIRARVVRTMPPDGVGVAFVNLSPTNRERLQRYIKAVVTN
jgi:CheY-like chemotaxis protein